MEATLPERESPFGPAQSGSELQDLLPGFVQLRSLGFRVIGFNRFAPLVQAVGGYAKSLRNLGYRITATDNPSHGFIFEFRGISLTAHRSSSMLKEYARGVYRPGGSPRIR